MKSGKLVAMLSYSSVSLEKMDEESCEKQLERTRLYIISQYYCCVCMLCFKLHTEQCMSRSKVTMAMFLCQQFPVTVALPYYSCGLC